MYSIEWELYAEEREYRVWHDVFNNRVRKRNLIPPMELDNTRYTLVSFIFVQ